MMNLKSAHAPSKRLVFSYIFDWIVIIAIAAVGGGWNYLKPYHRPFSLVDLNISFPFQAQETIPNWLLVVCCLIAPAAITFLVCLIFVPGPTASRGTPKALIWRRKLWEWNTAWMGLTLSLATAFMITQGMKHLFGKPRPDLLSRCQPDLSRINETAVNHFGEVFNEAWVLVTSDICTSSDDILQDGFKSFPSAHASFSWAGLLYLTLFLASKFSVAIPYLSPRSFSTNPAHTSAITPSNLKDKPILPLHHKEPSFTPPSVSEEKVVPIRYQAAAPPVYTLVLVLVPVGAAIYICTTRYTDFRHFGIDLVGGSVIGIVTAWFSFRWYHLPITRGAGWSWGPRSYERAWGIGVGRGTYVGTEGWSKFGRSETAATDRHIEELTESERHINGNGGMMESERASDERRAEASHAL